MGNPAGSIELRGFCFTMQCAIMQMHKMLFQCFWKGIVQMEYTLSDRRRTLIFINIVISGIASSMLATALTTALPSLVAYFGVSTSTGQWITSGYSLAMGMIMPFTAFLITKVPTKKLYSLGIGLFIAGLLLSICTQNFAIMMVGRILQACGNGMLLSTAQVVILTMYPLEKKGTMMGIYGLATTAAPVIAPTVAGLMIDVFGWKSIFYTVLAIMAASFIMSLLVFDDVIKLQDKKFDGLSFAESIVAFGGITLGVGNITNYGLISVGAGLPLLIGTVVCVFFVRRQLGLEKPFLDVSILRHKKYAISVISSMLLYFTMMGSSVLLPLYVQTVMRASAVTSGLVMLPGSLATAIISPLAGRIYDKAGIKKLFVAGSILLALSNVGMVFINLETSLAVAALCNTVRCAAIGGLMMPLLTWGVGYVEPHQVADASSMLTSFRTIAGSVGSAVFVGIMTKVGSVSQGIYGDSALMHGTNIAFLGMFLCAMPLVLIALFGVRNKSSSDMD